MAVSNGINAYVSNHFEGMSPEKLILMLYDGAVERIGKARDGIREGNIQKRGENLSKTIAIISELNASLESEENNETTRFLRGLYLSILTELPKVSTTNDEEILNRTERYIAGLRKIWIDEVMNKKQAVPKNQAAAYEQKSRLSSISV